MFQASYLQYVHLLLVALLAAAQLAAAGAVFRWPAVRGKLLVLSGLFLLFLVSLYSLTLNFLFSFSQLGSNMFSANGGVSGMYEVIQMMSAGVQQAGMLGWVLVACGLWQLRGPLLIAERVDSDELDFLHSSPRSPRTLWRGDGGTWLGAYRVNGERAIAVSQSCTLSTGTGNQFVLSGTHHPAGSAIMALVASVISTAMAIMALVASVISTAMAIMLAPSLGFVAAPGWLVWYLILVLVRRRRITLELSDADSIVVDEATSRVAFRTLFDSTPRWIVFAPGVDTGAFLDMISTTCGSRTSPGSIKAPSPWPILFLLVLIGGLVAGILQFALSM